jgi:RNA polymerase sigma factor (sigma-70 family)
MRTYRNRLIGELSAELCSGLRRLRRGYLDATEELIRLVDPDQTYPYDFVVFRLTGYRPTQPEVRSESIDGKSLRADLQSLLLDVSESFECRTADYDETVFDTSALAKRFRVSTKTVQRWRKRGLPARRMVFPDGRRRIGFLQSSVDWFTQGHKSQVNRGMNFSQLSDAERDEIIRRAKRMSGFTECTLTEVARRLARRMDRAAETIRYTIRKHDTENPGDAVFPKLLGTLGDVEKRRIYRAFLRGKAVWQLARTYRRTRGSIYRIINEMRARRLVERSISYVYNEEFDAPDAEESIIEREITGEPTETTIKPPSGLPAYLRSLYEVPLLSAERERDLFRRYNYLKYRADKLRKTIDVSTVKATELKNIESLLLQANMIKNRIVRANLRLVVSIAKKHVSGPLSLFELISDGNVSLMRAVEKFDYGRGFRFSTYASWAIMRNFARSVPKEKYQLDRFATGNDEVLDIAASLSSYDPNEHNVKELRESIDVMLEHLDKRERTILIDHYGLDSSGRTKTFNQLGNELGISKERVRQIEMAAMEKLRDAGERP